MSIEWFFGVLAAAVFLTGYLLGFFTRDVLRKFDRVESQFLKVLKALERLGGRR